MPIFIICCLLLTSLVNTGNPYLPLLNNEPVWLLAGCLAATFLICGWLKKIPAMIWHDGFATSGLLAWYAYWKPLFSIDSPLFYAFPSYFAFLSTLVLVAFINRSAQFDAESRGVFSVMKQNLGGFNSQWLASIVLICLALPEHYLSYPLAMTFFILLASFERCLEIIEQSQ